MEQSLVANLVQLPFGAGQVVCSGFIRVTAKSGSFYVFVNRYERHLSHYMLSLDPLLII